ncbi:MAG: terminase small subunit [Tagaea sp.]|nr:terminase small subunit [Tagaea sp.]
MSDPANYRGLEETARFFDVSVPTVRAWIQDGCPVVERGGNGVAYKLDLVAVSNWKKTRDGERARIEAEQAERDSQLRLELLGDKSLAKADGEGGLSKSEQASALAAEVSRTKLAQLRRELMPADEAKLKVTEAFGVLRDRIRTMPDQIAGELGLTEPQVERMLDLIDDYLDDTAAALGELIQGNPVAQAS